MPIAFDEIDAVVQSEPTGSAHARPSEQTVGDTKTQTVEQKLREWLATQRRAQRLLAD